MLIRKNTAWESCIAGVCGVGFVGDAEFGYHGRSVTTIEAPVRFDQGSFDLSFSEPFLLSMQGLLSADRWGGFAT